MNHHRTARAAGPAVVHGSWGQLFPIDIERNGNTRRKLLLLLVMIAVVVGVGLVVGWVRMMMMTTMIRIGRDFQR